MVRRVASFTNRWVAFLCVAALGCAVPASAAPAEPALRASSFPRRHAVRTHALGTQNYLCLATGSGLAALRRTAATLFVSAVRLRAAGDDALLQPEP